MTTDADLIAALLADAPNGPPPPPEPCPDDPRPRYECHECQWGCQTPPARCPKCGSYTFDRNDAYTPPEEKAAALKARAKRAMAEDAELRAQAVAANKQLRRSAATNKKYDRQKGKR